MAEEGVLTVEHLSKDFRQGGMFSSRKVHALTDVSFSVNRGEILALVGESGSGKSTIARIITRLEKPTAGRILVHGEDVLAREPRHASRRYRQQVQMVFQDPFGSLNPSSRVDHFLERPLLLHKQVKRGKSPRDAEVELLEQVGLNEGMLNSYPHQLSGGQRQRVAIARALAVDPSIILADEPTSMLDVSVRIGVLNLMRDLCDKDGISILYITHDLSSARYLADRTMVLFAGEVVETGESGEVMANPAHPYTRLLVSAVPDPHRSRTLDPGERSELRAAVQVAMYGPRGTRDNPVPGCTPVMRDLGGGHFVRQLVETRSGVAGELIND